MQRVPPPMQRTDGKLCCPRDQSRLAGDCDQYGHYLYCLNCGYEYRQRA